MARDYIRAFNGEILGWTEVRSDGTKYGYLWPGEIVAKYYPSRDTTTSFTGAILARGDACIGQIYAEHEKRRATKRGRGKAKQ